MTAFLYPPKYRKKFGDVVDTFAITHIEGLLPGSGDVLFSIIEAVMDGGPSCVAYRHPACKDVVGGVTPAQL